MPRNATARPADDVPPAVGPLGDYARQSARPLTSLIFVLPILILYEAGVLLLGPQAMRNGADVWLRNLLDLVGFGQYLLLPLLTVCLLLGWHHMRRDRWTVSKRVLGLMLAEAVVLSLLLSAIGTLQSRYLLQVGEAPALLDWLLRPVKLVVLFCGAGIYEELLFRLMLLPAIAGLARWAGAAPNMSWAIGVAVNSLLFSLAHYDLVTSSGEPLAVGSFVFRTLAGLFFSVLFLYRGFGIAAGTHTLYDVLVGIVRF